MLTTTEAGYDFLAEADVYSDGVVAQPGFEIVHARLKTAVPWEEGFVAVERILDSQGRPMKALCGLELRSPETRTFDGFAEFNQEYQRVLTEYGLLIDGRNPLARTNIVPDPGRPEYIVMSGFSFSVESVTSHRSFVTAGAAELAADALDQDAIVARGDSSAAGMRAKATQVMATMTDRLTRLQVGWDDVTTVNVYMLGDPHAVIEDVVLPQLGAAISRGITWYRSTPPVAELEFEMDVRGVDRELVLSVRDA